MSRLHRRCFLTLSLCLAAVMPLAAQEGAVALDTVEVQVSSRASDTLGGTRAVDVVDAREIRAMPASTINEVLQWAFGVEMMPRSPALADVSIRGSSFEQVLILVDGVRVRDAQTGHFNLNVAVPLDQVERIEVLRGPAASLYGSDAMGGVINIRTRQGEGSTSARLSHGSFDTTLGSLSHRNTIGGVTGDVAGSWHRSAGHRAGTDFEIANVRLGVAVPVAGESLHADIAHARRDFGADGFYGPYPSYEEIRTTTASVRWTLAIDSLSIEPRVSFRRNGDDFLLDREQPEGSRNLHTTDQFGGELIARVALSHDLRIALGFHGYHDRIESTALGDQREWTGAASFEAVAGRPDGMTGAIGVRADRLTTGSVVVSPAFSAAWRLSPAMRFRSSVGRSFRAPTWTERYYPLVGGNVGNPELTPERAWSADGGIDVYPSANIRFSGTGFVRLARDLIDWARPSDDDDAVWMTRNVESAEFHGVEGELELLDVAGFRVLTRGAWTSLGVRGASGLDSKYALRPQLDHFSVAVDRSIARVLTLGVRGARERRAGEAGYMRLDARGAVELAGLRLWMDINNAIDESYLDVIGNPAPGRSLAIGLDWRAGN